MKLCCFCKFYSEDGYCDNEEFWKHTSGWVKPNPPDWIKFRVLTCFRPDPFAFHCSYFEGRDKRADEEDRDTSGFGGPDYEDYS